MDEIELFRAAGLEPKSVAGLQLLAVDQVRRLLLVVERVGWVVWGLDGFEIVDGGVRPDMDQIADWSALRETCAEDLSARSVEETRRFLNTVGRHDRLYEVVVSERG